jgi:hypothetical protein
MADPILAAIVFGVPVLVAVIAAYRTWNNLNDSPSDGAFGEDENDG